MTNGIRIEMGEIVTTQYKTRLPFFPFWSLGCPVSFSLSSKGSKDIFKTVIKSVQLPEDMSIKWHGRFLSCCMQMLNTKHFHDSLDDILVSFQS